MRPVPGEFVLMRQSAFGITHDNVSASGKVSVTAFGFGIFDRRLSLKGRVRAVSVVIVFEAQKL